VYSTNEDGTQMVGNPVNMFTNYNKNGPVDGKFGPDGAFYMVHYAGFFGSDGSDTRIDKISYVGSCRPSEPKLERAVAILNPRAGDAGQAGGWLIHMRGERSILVPQGMVGFELYDLMGRKVWEIRKLRPGRTFDLPAGLQSGALKYRWIRSL
jgi:hypothetical protein